MDKITFQTIFKNYIKVVYCDCDIVFKQFAFERTCFFLLDDVKLEILRYLGGSKNRSKSEFY